jgi:uncharacterized protein (DUF302 family)
MNRLEAEVQAKGMMVFARVDHAAGAMGVGLSLRPTEVLIFGNAKAGTPLMQSVQTIGIDLPLKALVWQDTSGNTWLSYNDPAWLAHRHGLSGETEAAVNIMTKPPIVGGVRILSHEGIIDRFLAIENLSMHLALVVIPNLAARLRKNGFDRQQEAHLLRLEDADVSEAIIHVAMGSLLRRRISHEPFLKWTNQKDQLKIVSGGIPVR